MLGKRAILMIFGILLILAGFLPLITNVGADDDVIAPPVITGTINVDTTWNNDVILDGVTIANGVTVTVDPGVTLFMAPFGDLYIDGTMICKGTMEDPINVTCSVSTGTWDKVQVNATGILYFENFTLDKGSVGQTWMVQASGSCYLKHGMINGGYQGYHATGPGDLLLEDMEFANCAGFGLVILSHTGEVSINDIYIHNTSGGIALANVDPLEISDIEIYDIGMYEAFHFEGNTEAIFRDFRVWSDEPSSSGIGSHNSNNKIDFVNGQLSDLDVGIKTSTGTKNILEFNNVHFNENINNTVLANPGSSFNSTFTNCTLNAETYLFNLNGTSGEIFIDLINTTYERSANWNLEGENTWVNLSNYMDLDITNAAGDPVNSKFRYKRSEESSYTDIDSNDGQFERILFPDRMVQGEHSPVIITHDLVFMANSDPSAIKTLTDYNINRYQYRWMKLNLAPFNDFPEELNIEEDVWFDINLIEHFTDPDGLPMMFDAVSSDSLTLESMGNQTSGLFRVKNSDENWAGEGWIVFNGVDSGGRITEKNTTIIVQPINDPPKFTDTIPVVVTEEDTPVPLSFAGKIIDVEGSEIELTFPERKNYTTEYNSTSMNLTIIPAENFNGMMEVVINISDGENIVQEFISVNVTPVNDLPEISVMVGETSLEMTPYEFNETTEIMVYEMALNEDSSMKLWIDAMDIDSMDLTYSFLEDDLSHGSIDVETYQTEVIINETTNETEIQDLVVQMNFTYTPFANDHNGDLVRFSVNDGEGQTDFWIWFNVSSINDRVVITHPDEWNITVELNNPFTMDLSEMISDIDGDEVIITTSSDYIIVNGSKLLFSYNTTFTGEMEVVEITVSDGPSAMTVPLTVNIDRPAINDEPILGEMKMTAKEDMWTIDIEGSEGQDLWTVVEAEDGEVTSYKMEYENGVYSVNIMEDEGKIGLSLWISNEEDGEPIDDTVDEILPALKDSDSEDPFPMWIVILIVIIILLGIIIIVIVVMKNRSDEYYIEE